MFVKSTLLVLTLITCVSCSSSDNTGATFGTSVNDPVRIGGSPVDSGQGFVFAVAELYSNDPVGIVDVSFVAEGETSRLNLLHNGQAFHPYRHTNGMVTVTESCRASNGFVVEYRRISLLVGDGTTSPLTPCSSEINSPGGFTWIDSGRLSPNSQRLAARLTASGEPPITVVFEDGQEIYRYSGFDSPAWLDDDTLVMVGSRLVTVRLGEETVVISEAVTGLSIGTVAVSPDASQLAFEWERAIWVISVDGSGLRELLPAERYIFPTWSPDGRFVVAMQQQGLSAFDAQIAVSTSFFAYTNLSYFTVVNVDNGAVSYADVSMHLNDSQMPQGGLSWY